MNPIKWTSPYPVGQVQPRQVVSMRGGVVNPNMQPMYTALQQKANNQFTAMRDQNQFNRQIARDNLNHIRRRASMDYEFEKRKKLAEETERKLKEKEQFLWDERGGKETHEEKMKQLKLRTNLDTMKLMNTLVSNTAGVDQMKLNNQRASILGTQIQSMQAELDAMKGRRAEDFLRANIEDNDWTPNENFGESGYDWDTALDEGDISISGGPTFSKDKMSDEDIINTYNKLTGAQKIEFARQVARRKGQTFDDQVSVAEQEQQEKINKAMELLTSLQTASPDTIRMAESNLKRYLNLFRDVIPETEMNLQMLDMGTAPNFNPEGDEGMGRDAAAQRSLDMSSEAPTEGTSDDITAIANSGGGTKIKDIESSQPSVSPNPINPPRRSMDDSTALSRGLGSLMEKAKSFDPLGSLKSAGAKHDRSVNARIALQREAKKYGIPFTTYEETLRKVEAAKAQSNG